MPLIDPKRILWGTIIVTIIAACGALTHLAAKAATSSLTQPPSSRQAYSAPLARAKSSRSADSETRSTGDVIVSTAQGIYVYSNTLKPVAQITIQNYGYPAGLASDAAGNLYIANRGTAGIPVYKNDYKTLIATLSEPYSSLGIAVAKNGVVGVTDVPTNGGGHVTFYAGGSTTPCKSLSVPSVSIFNQGAFDASGNFYVTGQNSNSNSIVGVIRGGCSATSFTPLSTTNSLGDYCYGIQVTRFGKIAVENQESRSIYTYNPPVGGKLGQPAATTVLLGVSETIISQFDFTAEGAFLFIAEDSGNIAKYPYPAGGNPLQIFGQRQQLDHPSGLVVASPASS